MQKYTIEVDEEVYRFLKSKADVFVDIDANSVLRRLLLGRQINTASKKSVIELAELPDLSKLLPDGLSQVLELVYLVHHGEDRKNALKIVAKSHNIAIPTVADKYIRGLGAGMNTNQFDRMLEESGYNKLKTVLKKKFYPHQDAIDNFFKNL